MSSNVVVFGWNRSIPGREMTSAQHFQEFQEFLGAQQRAGTIESFQAVILEIHGGNLNGFFLVQGEAAKLQQLTSSADWRRHQMRASLHLEGATSIRGYTGAAVAERMQEWIKLLPRQ